MSKTLGKALQLLTLFSEEKPYWRLDEISKWTEVPKPTVFRLLKTFEEHGFVQKVSVKQSEVYIASESYELGTKLLELGQLAANKFEIRTISLPFMRDLQARINESVQLAIMEEDEAVYIEKVDCTKPVRLYTRIGRKAPLYAGACPRAIFSFLPNEKVDEILSQPMKKYGKNSILEKETIWKRIHETREQGYTYSDSELEDGTASIGTPIFDRFGCIAGSLSIAGLSSVLKEEDVMKYVPALWDACSQISRQLGYLQPYAYQIKT